MDSGRPTYWAFIILSLAILYISFLHASENLFAERKPLFQKAGFMPSSQAESASKLPGFPIDLNSAEREELMLLPGIGAKTAERIIEKRREIGGFRSVDQLTEVKWVGKVKVDRIRSLITVKESPQKRQKSRP